MEIYPPNLPQPLIENYSIEVDAGVLRSAEPSGLVRQRRLYDVMPQVFELTFVIPRNLLFSWQDWMNRYGYSYVQMDLVSWLSNNQQCTPHFVRIISNIALEVLDGKYMRAKLKVELSPAQLVNYNPPPENNWIIGGSPPLPSANWVIAGTPGAPSANIVTAGTPGAPS